MGQKELAEFQVELKEINQMLDSFVGV